MKTRTILDTNLWISYLISKNLAKIDRLFELDELILIFSEELLEEFVEVANRPKFRKYFELEDVEELLNLFEEYGEVVVVTSNVAECREEKDNFLLALARDGKADFLVTGDEDLLVLKTYESTEILNYSDFESRVIG